VRKDILQSKYNFIFANQSNLHTTRTELHFKIEKERVGLSNRKKCWTESKKKKGKGKDQVKNPTVSNLQPRGCLTMMVTWLITGYY
jgi:hypothetical protein